MAAADYFTSANALLDELTLKIQDITVGPSDKLALMCLNKFDKRKVEHQGLEAIIKFRTGKGGTRARGSAGGALAVGDKPTGIEGKLTMKKQTLGFEWDDEDLQKMKGGRKGLHTSFEEEITGGLEGFKLNQERLMYGDGSGVMFRVDGDPGTASQVSFGPGPCLAIEDDILEACLDRGTTADSGGEGTAAERRVVDVDHESKIVYLDAAIASGVADNEVYALSRGMSASQTTPGVLGTNNQFTAYPPGFAAALDYNGNEDGTVGVWDLGAASDYYHVRIYNYLDREAAANRKMLCGHKAAASAPVSLYWLSYGPSVLAGKGVPTGKMLLVMSVKQYNRTVEYFSGGFKTLDSANIILPGGKVTLPVVTAGGQANIPIMASPFMLDGAIATIVLGDWEQIYSGSGGFIPGTTGNLHLRPSNTATYDHVWQAFMPVYHNTTCMKPYRQFLVSGLDQTDG